MSSRNHHRRRTVRGIAVAAVVAPLVALVLVGPVFADKSPGVEVVGAFPQQPVRLVLTGDFGETEAVGKFRSEFQGFDGGAAQGRLRLEYGEPAAGPGGDGEDILIGSYTNYASAPAVDAFIHFGGEGVFCEARGRCEDVEITGSVRETSEGIFVFDLSQGLPSGSAQFEAEGRVMGIAVDP